MSRTVPTPAAPPAGPTARRESERERRHDIDLLRVVCTAAVVLVHASAEFIHAGHRTTGVVGFFGASSIERLPTEVAITNCVKQFKGLSL